ncbi:MAG: aminoglycoside phosphotransferase family protein [Pseudolysinimonas sp.]
MDTPPAEVSIDAALVTRLVAAQHPSLLAPVTWLSSGWDNELYRLGDDHVVRMPRRALAVPLIEHEQRWLPELQKLVEVPIPVPVAVGLPSDDYAWPWSIARWLPGEPVAHRDVGERDRLVAGLAAFVSQLHVPAAADAPVNPVRGVPLAARDDVVRQRLASGAIPHAEKLLELWAGALKAPVYAGPPIWIHGDLHPINVLADDVGRLAAVLDFGDLAGADPACDLAAAWLFFDEDQRAVFRELIGADGPHGGGAWERAVGWAVSQSTAFLQSSADAPVLDAIGRHTVEQLLLEL